MGLEQEYRKQVSVITNAGYWSTSPTWDSMKREENHECLFVRTNARSSRTARLGKVSPLDERLLEEIAESCGELNNGAWVDKNRNGRTVRVRSCAVWPFYGVTEFGRVLSSPREQNLGLAPFQHIYDRFSIFSPRSLLASRLADVGNRCSLTATWQPSVVPRGVSRDWTEISRLCHIVWAHRYMAHKLRNRWYHRV